MPAKAFLKPYMYSNRTGIAPFSFKVNSSPGPKIMPISIRFILFIMLSFIAVVLFRAEIKVLSVSPNDAVNFNLVLFKVLYWQNVQTSIYENR